MFEDRGSVTTSLNSIINEINYKLWLSDESSDEDQKEPCFKLCLNFLR